MPSLMRRDGSTTKNGRTVPPRARRRRAKTHPRYDSDDSSDSRVGAEASDDEDSDDMPPLVGHHDVVDDSSSSDDDVHGFTGYNNLAKTGSSQRISHGPRRSTPSRIDYSKYSENFPGSSKETIEKTFGATTQYGKRGAVKGTKLRRQIKAPNPALNVA